MRRVGWRRYGRDNDEEDRQSEEVGGRREAGGVLSMTPSGSVALQAGGWSSHDRQGDDRADGLRGRRPDR
eukprot:9470694-Pyramimonas_sp.AAC.1